MQLQNNQYINATVMSAPIGICILDANTLVAEVVNDKFLEVAGKPYAQIFGQYYWDAFAEAREYYEEALNQVVQTGIAYHADEVALVLIRNGQSEKVFINFVYTPIKNESGQVRKISVWVLENTAQVIARQEVEASSQKLKASREHLRNMVRQAPVGMCIVSGTPLYVEEVNEVFLEIVGKKREAFEHIPYWDVNAEAKLYYEPITTKVLATGEAFYAREHEIMLIRNGKPEQVHVDFVYEPMLDDHGKPFAIMIVVTEITDKVNARKKLQEFNEEMVAVNEEMAASNEELGATLDELALAHRNLEETNHRLNIALEAGALGATEIDLATGEMICSDQYKRNFGQPVDQPFDQATMLACILPAYSTTLNKLEADAIANRSVYNAEYQITWPDESIHWISAHGTARYDHNGLASRMIIITADITASKLFEQRKDDFLSIASHELKTPMTSLKGSLQLLERMKNKFDNQTLTKLIDQSVRSMQKMSELIEDLLQLNRLEVGELQLNPTTFVLAHLVDECCSHVRLGNTHKLLLEGDHHLTVYADQHRIEQVVVNFVNNAVKYAPDSNQIILKIETVEGQAKLTVTDFGPGIAPNKLDRLFERYYQVEHPKQNYEGLGLGLYISQEIIKRHHGEIGVDSTVGVGSSFWFTLPLDGNS